MSNPAMPVDAGGAPETPRLHGDTLLQPTNLFNNPIVQGHAQAHLGNSQVIHNGPVYYLSNSTSEPAATPISPAANLMKALLFDQMESRLATIGSAHAKTCQWLFAKEEYKIWQDPAALPTHGGFFWIKAKPAAGKSTLMKCAQRYGKDNHEGIVICFFFNARGGELQRSTEGMYRSLLYQILQVKPEMSSALAQYCTPIIHQTWSLEVLKNMFETAIRALHRTTLTCYIDALDECNDAQARDMVRSFESFGQSALDAKVSFRVMLASRRFPHIPIRKCLMLDLDDQAGHEADIAAYISFNLQIVSSGLATEIHKLIRSRASGVFLWVVLVVRILNEYDARGRTHVLRKRLEEIPDGLNKLFEEILFKEMHRLEDTLLLYQWILFAHRPLRPKELYFAVVTNSEDLALDDYNVDEITADVMERFLLDASKGLVELTKTNDPTVQFIHESVKEYLLCTGLVGLERGLSGALEPLSHNALQSCCQQYLEKCRTTLLPNASDGMREHMPKRPSEVGALRDLIDATHPFLGYALNGIIFHANAAHSKGVSQDDFVDVFPHELWRRLYNLTCEYPTHRLANNSPLIYTFVLKKAKGLAEILIQKTPSLAQRRIEGEYYLCPLGVAISNCDHKMLDLLLQYGADIYAPATSRSNSLALAIEKRNPSLVRTLIDGSADPVPAIQDHQCPLRCAMSQHSDENVIQTILSCRPYLDVVYWPEALTETLAYAQHNAYGSVLRMLLTKLDSMRSELVRSGYPTIPEAYCCALVAACSYGSQDLVEQFAEQGILRAKGTIRRAMAQAVHQGHLDVIRVLLSHTVDTDLYIDDDLCDPPLVEASRRGWNQVVSLLLDHIVNVHLCQVHAKPAVFAAAKSGHYDIVEVLFRRTDDLISNKEAYESWRRDLVHEASLQGHSEFLGFLMEDPRYCNTHLVDVDGHHAIYTAVKSGHINCVRVLLKRRIPREHLSEALQVALDHGRHGNGHFNEVLREASHSHEDKLFGQITTMLLEPWLQAGEEGQTSPDVFASDLGENRDPRVRGRGQYSITD